MKRKGRNGTGCLFVDTGYFIMAAANPYFPDLYSPAKEGTKTVKKRIGAAPALFAFEHYNYAEHDASGYLLPVPEKSCRMPETRAKGGSRQCGARRTEPKPHLLQAFPL